MRACLYTSNVGVNKRWFDLPVGYDTLYEELPELEALVVASVEAPFKIDDGLDFNELNTIAKRIENLRPVFTMRFPKF